MRRFRDRRRDAAVATSHLRMELQRPSDRHRASRDITRYHVTAIAHTRALWTAGWTGHSSAGVIMTSDRERNAIVSLTRRLATGLDSSIRNVIDVIVANNA